MGKSKIVNRVLKSAGPLAKKGMPVIRGVMNSIGVIEQTSKIAQPFIEEARVKNIEKAKQIFVTQTCRGDWYTVGIARAGIFGEGRTGEEALTNFINRLQRLRRDKVLSSNKRQAKCQMKLIEKMNAIGENDDMLRHYIYRIETKVKDCEVGKCEKLEKQEKRKILNPKTGKPKVFFMKTDRQ